MSLYINTCYIYIVANELLTETCNRQEAGPYMGIDDVPDYNEGLMMVEYLDSFGNTPPMNNQGISTTTVPQNNDVVRQDQREVHSLYLSGVLVA